MNTAEKTSPKRKSLAVDEATYNLLEEICFHERRTKIQTLKDLIEEKHDYLFRKAARR